MDCYFTLISFLVFWSDQVIASHILVGALGFSASINPVLKRMIKCTNQNYRLYFLEVLTSISALYTVPQTLQEGC